MGYLLVLFHSTDFFPKKLCFPTDPMHLMTDDFRFPVTATAFPSVPKRNIYELACPCQFGGSAHNSLILFYCQTFGSVPQEQCNEHSYKDNQGSLLMIVQKYYMYIAMIEEMPQCTQSLAKRWAPGCVIAAGKARQNRYATAGT